MSITLSNWVRVSDEVAVNTSYFCAAAQPNTSFTMAETELASTHNGGVRNVTATTAGAGDNGKTVTLTGTDSDGASLTEIITLPGSATTTAGTELFKTVTAAEMSAQPAANVSLVLELRVELKLAVAEFLDLIELHLEEQAER
jgi:bifunctional ADP-heptose synthase (sugar kinase/adenylyltransferase)